MRRAMLQKVDTGSYLFDVYPNGIIGFSFFRLKGNYTNDIVWIERSSDNAIQEFALDGDSVNTSDILSFVGSGNGIVKRWYNQGSLGGYFEATIGNEPLIVSSGTIVTDNSVIAMDFVGGKFMDSSLDLPSIYSGFVIGQFGSAGTNIIGSVVSTGVFNFRNNLGSSTRFRHTLVQAAFPAPTIGNQQNLACFRYDDSNIQYLKNGTDLGSQPMDGEWGNRDIRIGLTNNKLQEVIYFSDDKRSNSLDIISNRNSIYNTF